MNRHEGRQFSVRRDRDAAEHGMFKRLLRGPACARNFLQHFVAIAVEHSLPVGSASGKSVEFAGCEFFGVGSVGIRIEDSQPVRFAARGENHRVV